MIWIKHHIEAARLIFLWFTGFTWTIVIDWEHIVSRITETCIIAFWNGAATTLGGIVLLWFIRAFKKTRIMTWIRRKFPKYFNH